MNSDLPLPDWVERRLEDAPQHSDKRTLADIFSDLFAPTSHRTVEERPFVWSVHNGYAVTHTRTAVKAEYDRFNAAPRYRSGRAKKTA